MKALKMDHICDCKYQKEQDWGYQVFKWYRGKWKSIGKHSNALIAAAIGDNCKRILVTCRGCGREL